MLLKNRVAVVTGAGSGIGREITYKLAENGAQVVVSDINPDGGSQTARNITSRGGMSAFFKADTFNALWLSSEKASFVTGSYYPVDGGYLAQ